MLAPLIDVKLPPTSRWPFTPASVSTPPFAEWAKVLTTLPVLVLIAAMFDTLVPLTDVKWPPM